MMKRIYMLLIAVAAIFSCYAEVVVSYARQGQNLTLDLGWNKDSYGKIQWQKLSDDGVTWTDIKNATGRSYTVRVGKEATYRVKLVGDESCPPFYQERKVIPVSFDADVLTVGSNMAEMEVSGIDLKGASITEYGFCANYSSLSRDYSLMNRTKVGDAFPQGDSFMLECTGLLPNQSYYLRLYMKTSDGSMLFGPGRLIQTLPGLAWTTENWTISKTSIGACFEIPGYTDAANPDVEYWFGKDKANMKKYNAAKGDGYAYTADIISGLTPNTEYIAMVKATIDGEEQVLEKTVKTLPDYSNVVVDTEVKPVSHKIVWQTPRNPVRLSPEGQAVEYPRMLRVSDSKLLLSYGGGRGTDYWVNCYLRKSYDNGHTWTEPEIIFDKEQSPFGTRYWRFVNPEMIKLRN